jgi:hypothetical protein
MGLNSAFSIPYLGVHMKKREVVIVSCLAVVAFFLAVVPLSDFDFWWHLAVGRLHVEQHLFPKTDPFSHTAANLFWDDKEWLFGILIYQVYKFFGLNGAILFKALVVAATFPLVYFTSRRFTSSPAIAASLALLSALSSRIIFTERPWLFTSLMEALFLLIIYKAREKNPKLLWSLPVLMIAWVNLHPAAIIGILVIFAFVVESLVAEIRKGDGTLYRRLLNNSYRRNLLAVSVITPLAFLINPNTTFRYTSLYELIFRHTKFITSLEETMPAPFSQDPYFYVLLLLSAGLVLYRWKKTSASDLVLLLGTGYLAISWKRNIPIFSIACIPFLTSCFDGLLLARKKSAFRVWHETRRAAVDWGTVAVLLFVALLVSRSQYFSLGIASPRFPEAATQYVLANGLQGNLYNIYDWGGYHLFRMYPEHRVFIDGRGPDAYTPEIWQEYEEIRDGSADYDKILERNNVEIIFISTADDLQNLIARLSVNSRWGCVFRDGQSAIYVRAGSRNMNIANENNWKRAAAKSFNEGDYQAALGYIDNLKILNPNDIEPWFNAGIIYGRYLRNYDEAIANFRRVIELDSTNVDARVNLAALYQKTGDKAKAVSLLSVALKLSPGNETIRIALEALQK